MRKYKMTYDDKALMDADGSPIADSTLAHKILMGCSDNLAMPEMTKLIDLLVAGDMLDKKEARDISASLRDTTLSPEMASDAQILARRRQQVAAGMRPASCLRDPISRMTRRTAQDQKNFDAMFPDAARIGHAY